MFLPVNKQWWENQSDSRISIGHFQVAFFENKLRIQIHFYVNQTKVLHKTCFETEAERNSEMALIAINI